MSVNSIKALIAKTPFKPLIFFGPSGSGKSTLAAHVLSKNKANFDLSVSTTTRAKRPSEVPGVSYHFTSHEQFLSKANNNKFLEYMQYNGNYYGTSISELSRIIASGRSPILDIDINGVKKFIELFGEANSIRVFVNVTDHSVLKQRLRGRNTETEESLNNRLAITLKELQYLASNKLNTHVVDNNDLDAAKREIDVLVQSQYKLHKSCN